MHKQTVSTTQRLGGFQHRLKAMQATAAEEVEESLAVKAAEDVEETIRDEEVSAVQTKEYPNFQLPTVETDEEYKLLEAKVNMMGNLKVIDGLYKKTFNMCRDSRKSKNLRCNLYHYCVNKMIDHHKEKLNYLTTYKMSPEFTHADRMM